MDTSVFIETIICTKVSSLTLLTAQVDIEIIKEPWNRWVKTPKLKADHIKILNCLSNEKMEPFKSLCLKFKIVQITVKCTEYI